MVKKWWPKFLTAQKQEKVLAPGTSRHRPHTHSGSPLGLQGWFGLESHCHRGDHVGALRWSCGGSQSKEGHVTAGRSLNPPPTSVALSPGTLSPLTGAQLSPALPGGCRQRLSTADSPHHVRAGETGQCPGPSVTSHSPRTGLPCRGRQGQEAATTCSHRDGGLPGRQPLRPQGAQVLPLPPGHGRSPRTGASPSSVKVRAHFTY